MRRSFKLQDLDCANCAAKMECGIQKIDGVNSATISFMTQKLVVDVEDSKFDEVMDEIVRVCARVEPDTVILR